MTFWKSLSRNRKLALLAFTLGLLAVFAGNPYHGTSVTIDAKELAMIVDNKVDHIDVTELTDWIMKRSADYRLIDLRSEQEYRDYHIPTSENIPTAKITDANFSHTEKLVLYSEGGIHSAQAWFLLRSKGYKAVYILFGGLEEWNDRILFPKIAVNATTQQQSEFTKMSEVSKFFGGTPQTGSNPATTPKMEPPKPMPSGGGSSAPAASGGKKKKEGC